MFAWLKFFQFFFGTFTLLFFLFYFFMDYPDKFLLFAIVCLLIISIAVGLICANLPQADDENLSTDSFEEDPFEEDP